MDETTDIEIKQEEVNFELIKVEEPSYEPDETNEIVLHNELRTEVDELKIDGKEEIDEDIEFTYVKTEQEDDLSETAECEQDPLDILPAVETKCDIQFTEEDPSCPTTSQETDFLNCPKCGNKFIMDELEEHRKNCLHCDAPLSHVNTNTSTQGMYFKCNKCDYFTLVKSMLDAHMKTHGTKQFNYISRRLTNLTDQTRPLSGDKPYKCTQCNYSAPVSSKLRLHMRIHSGEKPYKCTQCSYASSQSSSLIVHMRIHSRETPYKCTQCNYSAMASTRLKSHMRTHSGEKPYKCVQCSYSATESGNLRIHMRVHSGVKPYKCTECNYSSAHPSHLRRHMKVHFKDKSGNGGTTELL